MSAQRQRLKDAIGRGNYSEALQLLDELLRDLGASREAERELIMHRRQLADIERRERTGLLSQVDASVRYQQLTMALLSFADSLDDAPALVSTPGGPPDSSAPRDRYDFFVSYAAEDRMVVVPLVSELMSRGATVWVDRSGVAVGDGLRAMIEAAISASAFGVAVISAHYRAKRWTLWEMDAILARETEPGRSILLPVRHGITIEDFARHFPLLAMRRSIGTEDGIARVADELIRVRDR